MSITSGIPALLTKAALARAGLARFPFAVSFEITTRCNRRCKYCASWSLKRNELDTDDVFSVLEDLAVSGTRYLSFTGGEPLMRRDFGEIVSRGARLGMSIVLTSNGDMLPERINELKGLSKVVLSLDGPKPIQDAIRGKGAFDRTIEAAETASAAGLAVEFTCVLSSANLEHVGSLLEIVDGLGLKVNFQPAYTHRLREKGPDPMTPPVEGYEKAMAYLVARKRSGARAVGNTLSGLKYLAKYPGRSPISCAGGRLFMRIRSDGKVEICGIGKDKPLPGVDVRDGVMRAIKRLVPPDCDACWCSRRTEVNLAWSGHLDAVLNVAGRTFGP